LDGLKIPVLFVAKFTMPAGVVGLDEGSVTVTVQALSTFVMTEPGEQSTDVVGGGRRDTARSKVPSLAP
jgi:hypothetical protein